ELGVNMSSQSSRTSRTIMMTVALVVALVAGLTLTFPGAASAIATRVIHPVPAPPAAPKSDKQIQNLDQVTTAIKGYYGDTATATPDPVTGLTTLHEPAANGRWAKQASGTARTITKYIKGNKWKKAKSKAFNRRHPNKAILFDVDDTSLVTYDYEIYSNFVYNPTSNAAFVNGAVFPGVPGMAAMAQYAASHGYTVFFLTGRPEAQRAGTITNLTKAGFPVASADLYLKDQTKPWLASCAPACSTIQYKSLTRGYIESQGFNIVANAGDQFSDLKGGHARKTFKMPNPMYFLP
ncbi:MAG: acid phosphatase, partial [Nocardioidaceae bacterium]|nr:acid phosphatase [Nocardioidaceae bacterium]